MADSITGATSAPSLVPNAAASPTKPMDKEAFLKLLVAQIKNQDPLKPLEGTEFVAQLSQFAVVEQALQQSSQLDQLSTQMRGLSNHEATALVGKRVTVRGQAMAYDGVLAATSSSTLSGPAAKVKATIVDANGNAVRSMELGGRPAGTFTVTWDGKDNNGVQAPKGTYTVKIEAVDAAGEPVGVTTDVQGTVKKVSFEKGYPELLLDSGATAPISDLVAVEQETR
jgi:flagellar basal-body rod modification protein FlgD